MNYDFINIKTKKVFQKEMKMAELDDYLAANPNIKRYHTAMNIGDAVRMGITKPDAWYQKNVIGKILDKTPGANKDTKFSRPREW